MDGSRCRERNSCRVRLVGHSVSLLAVFLGKDLGGCDTTNESWRTGKDLVGKSAEYVGFVGCELEKRAIALRAISALSDGGNG